MELLVVIIKINVFWNYEIFNGGQNSGCQELEIQVGGQKGGVCGYKRDPYGSEAVQYLDYGHEYRNLHRWQDSMERNKYNTQISKTG